MSTLIKRYFLLSLLVILLVSCGAAGNINAADTPTPIPPVSRGENPFGPQPGDEAMAQDPVQIVKTELLTLESSPVQFVLKISFFMPTPCHQYRISISQPGANNQINVEVYSLRKPNQVCTLMALSTPTEVSLNLGSFTAGHYSVWVNDEKATEFNG